MSRVLWITAAALLAAALAGAHAQYAEHAAGAYTVCSGCFLLPTLGHDAWLLSAVCLLLGLGSAARAPWASRCARIAAALLILVQATDLGLLHLLNQRLYVADVRRYAGDASSLWSVLRSQLFAANGIGFLAFALGTLVVLAGLVAGPRAQSARAGRVLLLCSAAAAGSALIARSVAPLHYVHDWLALNVVEANFPQGREKPFSAAFAARAAQRSQALPLACDRDSASSVNVVLVITESLSAYQSALLGGPRDWLPRLDALARANHYFTHFYANGFTTDGGEIAAITGRVPLSPAGAAWYSNEDFELRDGSVPQIAHRAGHGAYYFTTADLAFEDAGAWLRGLGFDAVEGSESPFYAALPRLQFHAAADAALFARFEQWLDQRHESSPFVAVLLTTTSHPPFQNPLTNQIDPAGTFGYVDTQLVEFHDRLARRGFFRDGMLLLTGDHRSMTPIGVDEYAQFGERAFARVPMIVAGAQDMPGVIDAAFQQADFPASLARLLGVEHCRGPFTGAFLGGPPLPAQYITHVRGDNRNRVDIYFGDRVAGYLEDGDASHWLGPERPPDADGVAAWINAQRIPRPLPATEKR